MGTLYIVSTPIGNLEDTTIRAIKTLCSVDTILCEDTRHSGNLLHELRARYPTYDSGKLPKLLPYFDQIEHKMIPEVIETLKTQDIALVSDAGTPLVSDPGFRLVRECVKRGIQVISVPGPSALLTALTSSGLPTDKFLFLGYPPEKQSARLKWLKNIPADTTTIMYCAPHKLNRTLTDLRNTYGNIPVVLGRELTKLHEEIWHGTTEQAISHFASPQGEFVVLFRL